MLGKKRKGNGRDFLIPILYAILANIKTITRTPNSYHPISLCIQYKISCFPAIESNEKHICNQVKILTNLVC